MNCVCRKQMMLKKYGKSSWLIKKESGNLLSQRVRLSPSQYDSYPRDIEESGTKGKRIFVQSAQEPRPVKQHILKSCPASLP